ncbi:MAG: ribulose-phosphate 3-epimerase [Planctomycetes bacterium]|nr:ribulose-phosphate 3-epimerase [Planctomycetota bacterium]
MGPPRGTVRIDGAGVGLPLPGRGQTKAVRPVTVLPSLLSADFARLADELRRCEQAGARLLHVDVMDAHFVPNLTFGPFIVAAMRRSTRLHLDVHLMMTDPLRYVADFRAAGADAITIHVEAVGPRHCAEAIERVRSTGAAVGLALNPDTDPELWFSHFAKVDLVMFMTVYPGFGGQSFIPQVRARIRATRAAFPTLPIQVDGGINRETIPLVLADGADRLVTGNAFFNDPDPAGFLRWAETQANAAKP